MERENEKEQQRKYRTQPVRRRKKKAPLWIRILVIVASVLFLILMFGIMFVFSQLDKINQAESVTPLAAADEYFETDENESAFDSMNPDDVEWSDNEKVSGDDEVINILLIGQDRRPGETRARSDSMIIASINKSDNTIKLTSLMRDLYVQLPGYSDNRINAAYAFGGMELLDATIKKNFDIDIDGNIEVDFSGFEKVVDLVGGVDISLTPEEADIINRANTSSKVTSGMQHLNGAQALTYSRIRYIGNGDFGRTERQRKVLMSAYSNVKKLSLTEMLELADVVFPLITTDQSSLDLIGLATDVFNMNVASIETHNIPADASYKNANIRGMAVLVPDLDECRKVLKSVIYGE